MSNQSYRNQQSAYFLRDRVQDEIDQLQETVAIRPLIQTENAIVRWDDPGTGTPIPDNAGATKNSTVFIDDNGNVTNANSISLLQEAANPGGSDTLWVNSADGELYKGTQNISGLAGDVVGPVSSTDDAIARFDSTTGKVIQNSLITINDTGDIRNTTAPLTLQQGEISIDKDTNDLNFTVGAETTQELFQHTRAKGGLTNWYEADSDGVSAEKANICLATRRANKAYYSKAITTSNNVEQSLACDGTIVQPDLIIKTGGTYAPTPTGMLPAPTGLTTAMLISGTDHKVTTNVGLITDSIETNPSTGATGINIENINVNGGVITNATSLNGKSVDTLVNASTNSTDNAICRFDGTSGELIQNSGITIDDSDNLVVSGTVQTDGIISFPGTGATGVNLESVNVNTGAISGVTTINTKPVDTLVNSITTSSDNQIVRFNGNTGESVQNSNILIDDNDNIGLVNSVGFVDLVSNPVPATTGILWKSNAGPLRVGPNDYNVLTGTNTAKTIGNISLWASDDRLNDDLFYKSDSYTITFTGDVGSPSIGLDVKAQRIGNFVQIDIQGISLNLSGVAYLASATGILDSSYLPLSTTKTQPYARIDLGTLSGFGIVSIVPSTGEIRVYYDNGSGTWPSGAGSGWSNVTFSYHI